MWALALSHVLAGPIDRDRDACAKYILLDTRGTGEPVGPSLSLNGPSVRLTRGTD